MMIQQAILHILDFNGNMCILSQKELDFTSDIVYEYVDKRINRMIHDAGQQSGIFYATSAMQMELQQLQEEKLDFKTFASNTAKKLYDVLSHCEMPESLDALFVDFRDDDDIRNIAVILLENKTAYTHQILDDEGAVYNQLIKHQAILPGLTQKVEGYGFVKMKDFSIHFIDKKRSLDGEELYVLPDRIFQCTATISGRDAVKLVSKIAAKVAEDHGASTVEALSKAKNYLAENAETEETFSPKELGVAAFASSPQLQEEFKAQLAEAKLPEHIEIQKEFAQRTGRQHKIKTDTGIEITFPSEYVENTDYIQFINNPDGTISIELKNIGKIINK